MTANVINTGSILMAFVIASIFIYLAVTGRLPRRDGELDRLRKLEKDMTYLQDEDIRKGQMIAKLQTENAELHEEIRFLKAQLRQFAPQMEQQELPLLVVTGNDPNLSVDVAALRGSGMRLTTLLAATARDLKIATDRLRRSKHGHGGIHFSIHAGPDGLQLDRLVNREELNEMLSNTGLTVCMIMGCTSAEIGDLLTVIPSVVVFNKPIAHEDAWQFGILFWKAIGDGKSTHTAFNLARDRAPTKVSEAAELIEL